MVAPAEIGRAAQALRRGELVIFPTETVYGIGADARNPDAVRRIFQAKGRPLDNPVIVHVLDEAAAREVTAEWPSLAARLAQAFWPGPLTLVLPRAAAIPPETSGGLSTVAVRVPAHPVARALLAAARVPIAAPSANRSGRPSPTRAGDARADLGAHAAAVLDAGPCEVGVESTVVALGPDGPVLLRPGGVSRECLEAVVGPMRTVAGADERAASPGTRYRHYAPQAQVVLAAPDRLDAEAARLRQRGLRVVVLAATESTVHAADTRRVAGRQQPEEWARRIFALLRDLDEEGAQAVVVEAIPEEGLGAAVLDRLRRAAASAASD